MFNETLSNIFYHLSDTLNISDSDTQEIITSYNSVGSYLGNIEKDLDYQYSFFTLLTSLIVKVEILKVCLFKVLKYYLYY